MLRTVNKPFGLLAGAFVLVVSVLFALPGVASAAPCVIDPEYSGGPTITTDPSGTVSPGEQIEIIGTGFPPGCEVDITIDGTVVGTVTTTAEGTFSFPYIIPSNFVGSLTIVITAGDWSQTITLQVVAATTTTTQPPLVTTGSSSGTMASVGLGLLAGGGLIVLLTRKRRDTLAA